MRVCSRLEELPDNPGMAALGGNMHGCDLRKGGVSIKTLLREAARENEGGQAKQPNRKDLEKGGKKTRWQLKQGQ